MENLVTITIDTYSFISNLKTAGFSEEQAKAVMNEVLKIKLYNVATKDDINDLREATKDDINSLKNNINDLKVGLKEEIHALDLKIETTTKDILKWVIPLILGLYAMMFSMFAAILFKLH